MYVGNQADKILKYFISLISNIFDIDVKVVPTLRQKKEVVPLKVIKTSFSPNCCCFWYAQSVIYPPLNTSACSPDRKHFRSSLALETKCQWYISNTRKQLSHESIFKRAFKKKLTKEPEPRGGGGHSRKVGTGMCGPKTVPFCPQVYQWPFFIWKLV